MGLGTLYRMIDLVTIAFALLIYFSILHGEFVFDDLTILANNLIEKGKWRPEYLKHWRGLTFGTYAAELQWFGHQQTESFHFVNIALHAINGLLVSRVFVALGVDETLAGLGGLVFVVHPLATNAVAYVAARPAVLSATFSLVSMLVFLNGHWVLALLPMALAFQAKEDSLLLSVFLFALRPAWGWAYLALPFIIIPWKWKAIRDLFKNNGDEGMDVAGFQSSLKQPAYTLTSIVEHLIRYPRWMLGMKQNVDADVQEMDDPWTKTTEAIGVLLMTLALLWISPWLRLPVLLMVLSPWTLYLVAPVPDLIVEHRAYLSILGISLLCVRMMENAPAPLWIGLITYFACRSIFRANRFTSVLGFWQSAAKDGSPEKPRVLVNIGAAYQLRNELDKAAEQYDKVLETHPNIAPALANLAWIECRKGRPQMAIPYLEKCVERCPKYSLGWQALGEVYAHLKNHKKSEYCLKQAVEVRG